MASIKELKKAIQQGKAELKKKKKDVVYKIWIEIEEYNEKTGNGENVEMMGLVDFASSAQFDTLHEAAEFVKDLDKYANNGV